MGFLGIEIRRKCGILGIFLVFSEICFWIFFWNLFWNFFTTQEFYKIFRNVEILFQNPRLEFNTKYSPLYVNRLADEFEEKDVRKRKWYSLEEAQKMLCAFKPIQAKYLVALKQSKSLNSQSSTTQCSPKVV